MLLGNVRSLSNVRLLLKSLEEKYKALKDIENGLRKRGSNRIWCSFKQFVHMAEEQREDYNSF